jgi:ribosome-binding protein aMBF1 (putative translation factor)
MSDFQDYLDNALNKVSFAAKENLSVVNDYDVFAEIREQIVKAREDKQLTQKDLARLSGLTQSNISNIENGSNRPTISTLKKIADALGKRLIVDLID